jgi:hypothetical protein
MITDRMLRRWRREALPDSVSPVKLSDGIDHMANKIAELSNRIIRLTQELMDQNLLREVKK